MLHSAVIALLHLLKNRFLGQSVGRKTVSLFLDTTQEPAKGMCAPLTKISYRLRSDLLTWSCAGTALQIRAGPAIPTVQVNTMVIVQRAQILCHPARHCRQLFSSPSLFCLLCPLEGHSSKTLESLWCNPSKMESKSISSTIIYPRFYGTYNWRWNLVSAYRSDSNLPLWI